MYTRPVWQHEVYNKTTNYNGPVGHHEVHSPNLSELLAMYTRPLLKHGVYDKSTNPQWSSKSARGTFSKHEQTVCSTISATFDRLYLMLAGVTLEYFNQEE